MDSTPFPPLHDVLGPVAQAGVDASRETGGTGEATVGRTVGVSGAHGQAVFADRNRARVAATGTGLSLIESGAAPQEGPGALLRFPTSSSS